MRAYGRGQNTRRSQMTGLYVVYSKYKWLRDCTPVTAVCEDCVEMAVSMTNALEIVEAGLSSALCRRCALPNKDKLESLKSVLPERFAGYTCVRCANSTRRNSPDHDSIQTSSAVAVCQYGSVAPQWCINDVFPTDV